MADSASREAVAAVWRIESARIVGVLARYTGDFALAEQLAQEALAEGLETRAPGGGPAASRGPPPLDEGYAPLAGDLGEGGTAAGRANTGLAEGGADSLWDPDRI